jgi:hypothetical protein
MSAGKINGASEELTRLAEPGLNWLREVVTVTDADVESARPVTSTIPVEGLNSTSPADTAACQFHKAE